MKKIKTLESQLGGNSQVEIVKNEHNQNLVRKKSIRRPQMPSNEAVNKNDLSPTSNVSFPEQGKSPN